MSHLESTNIATQSCAVIQEQVRVLMGLARDMPELGNVIDELNKVSKNLSPLMDNHQDRMEALFRKLDTTGFDRLPGYTKSYTSEEFQTLIESGQIQKDFDQYLGYTPKPKSAHFIPWSLQSLIWETVDNLHDMPINEKWADKMGNQFIQWFEKNPSTPPELLIQAFPIGPYRLTIEDKAVTISEGRDLRFSYDDEKPDTTLLNLTENFINSFTPAASLILNRSHLWGEQNQFIIRAAHAFLQSRKSP